MNSPNPYESSGVEHQESKKRSNMIFVVLVGLTILSMLLFFWLLTPVYETKSQVMPQPTSSGTAASSGSAPNTTPATDTGVAAEK